jgi:hypothetical protein
LKVRGRRTSAKRSPKRASRTCTSSHPVLHTNGSPGDVPWRTLLHACSNRLFFNTNPNARRTLLAFGFLFHISKLTPDFYNLLEQFPSPPTDSFIATSPARLQFSIAPLVWPQIEGSYWMEIWFSQICWTGAADEFFDTARFPAAG